MKNYNVKISSLTEQAKSFTSTLSYDKHLFKHDIMGAIAHTGMLGEYEIITQADSDKIRNALQLIFFDYTKGNLEIDGTDNVFNFIDAALYKKIGVLAEKIDIARNHCDRAALDTRLYVREGIDELNELLKALTLQIVELAFENTRVLMPAYAHSLKSQPTNAAHYLAAYCEMFARDLERLFDLRKRVNIMPLYSMSGTGTTVPVSRKRVADLLGFSGVVKNTLDAVSDRDYIIEYLNCCTIIFTHLSTFAGDIIRLSSDSYKFVELSEGFTTASDSGLKGYAVVLEAVRAKASKISAGYATAVNTITNAGSGYSAMLDACLAPLMETESDLKESIEIILPLLYEIGFNTFEMQKAALSGFNVSDDCVNYLLEKGLAKEEARSVVSQLVDYCTENRKRLDTIPYEIYLEFSNLFDEDIVQLMRPRNAVRLRRHEGGPNEGSVKVELRAIKRRVLKLVPDKD